MALVKVGGVWIQTANVLHIDGQRITFVGGASLVLDPYDADVLESALRPPIRTAEDFARALAELPEPWRTEVIARLKEMQHGD
jgi:hypothetical protein